MSGQPLRQHEAIFRFLPEDTVAALLIPNPKRSLQSLTRNRVLSSVFTNVQHRAKSAHSPFPFSWTERVENILSQSWLHRADILEKLSRITVIALLDSGERRQPTSTGFYVPYHVAILAEIEQEEEFLAWLLEGVLPVLQAGDADVEPGVFEFHGETLYRIQAPDFQLYYTLSGHTFLASTNRNALQRLVAGLQQDDVSAITQHFTAVAEYSANADLFIAIRLSALWPSVQTWLQAACSPSHASNAAVMLELLKSYRWPFVAWDLTIDETLLTENLRIWYPHVMEQNVSTVSDGNSTPPTILSQNRAFVSDRFVSDQAIYYGARHINLSAWWQQMLGLMQAMPDASPTRAMTMWRAEIEKILQKPIATLMTEIGTVEIGTAWYPPKQLQRRPRRADSLSRLPLLCILQADSSNAIAHVLRRIAAAFDLAASRTAFQDIEILGYQIPFFGTPQTLFYAAVDDVLLFSWSDDLIKDSIRNARYGHSLAALQDYRSTAFPRHSLTRGYLSLSQTARQLRAYWERQPSSRDNSAPEFIDILVPLPSLGWATTHEPEKLLTTSASPLGGSMTGVLILWFAVSLIL